MKECPFCNSQLKDDSLYCTECGKPIPQGRVCPYCGASVNVDDSFCHSCGKSINELQSESPSYVEEKEKSSFKKYLPYILGAFVVLVIIGYYSSNESTSNNKETKDFVASDSIEEGISVESDESLNKQLNETYMNLISEREASQYYLSDISGDGFPELFLKKYFDVTYSIDVYTIYNDSTILLLAIGGSGNNKEYIGKNYLLSLSSGNDYCVWRKYEFKEYASYSINDDIIYKGYLEDNENFYKEPTEPLIEWNNVSNEKIEESTNLDWLQGHWVYEGELEAHLVIKDNTVRQFSSLNPESTFYTFRIDGNTMYIKPIKNDGTDFYVTLDYSNQRIDYGDGNWMHKISSDSEDDYSSSTSSSSSSQRPFNDEGDILARIYNQRFRHSSGLEIRVDGYGRIEIDGDPAGVLSVLRYNSESALLRYGNGMYGEGKILLKRDGSRLLLQDPVDGSVFYQR